MTKRLAGLGLVKAFARRRVVDGVSVEVRPGEIVGLLGPNGAGKTTSFRMVAGLLVPDEGRVELDGEDVTRLTLHRRARRGLGYLPQESSVFRKLSVRDNLLVALEGVAGLTRRQRSEKAETLIDEFHLGNVRDALGETLSGGERRRCEIARSLATGPSYLLFDEPFAGVDPINVGDIQRQMSALRGRGLGILITDHAVRETLGICDRAYILAGGKLLEEGTPEQIAGSEKARAAYLGESFRLERPAGSA